MIYLVLLKLLIEKLNKMNKRIFKIGTFALLMGLSLTTTSCDKDEEKEPASVSTTQTTQAPQTIAEIASADENFSIYEKVIYPIYGSLFHDSYDSFFCFGVCWIIFC